MAVPTPHSTTRCEATPSTSSAADFNKIRRDRSDGHARSSGDSVLPAGGAPGQESTIRRRLMGNRASSDSALLTPPPAAPDRKTAVVAELQDFIALLHFGRDDRRFAGKGRARALHLDFVLRLDLHVLVLQIPAWT